MSLREECLQKWFCEENMDNTNNWDHDQRMAGVINKVLDAAVEVGNQHIEYIRKHTSQESNIRLIGIDVIEDYQEAINKLRDEK